MTAPGDTIRLTGTPRERGRQYGTGAAELVRASQRAYAEVYREFAHWDVETVRREALRFVPAIEAFHPDSLEEIRGIAEGAGLAFADVLAMNLRTEILFAAKARKAEARVPSTLECTSFADTRGTAPLVGQNWDWIPFSRDTVVVLEVETATTSWVTVVEAGLLAKFGLNSHGVAIMTNALVSTADRGEPGVPYHVMLRSLMESADVADAEHRLRGATRSSSANYLVMDATGAGFDAETAPGDASAIRWTRLPRTDDEALVHANHFLDEPEGERDLGHRIMPDSLLRQGRAGQLLAAGAANDLPAWERLLADHVGYPDSLCCHPDPAVAPLDRGQTVASVIVEIDRRLMHLTIGNPCTEPRVTRDYSAFLAARTA